MRVTRSVLLVAALAASACRFDPSGPNRLGADDDDDGDDVPALPDAAPPGQVAGSPAGDPDGGPPPPPPPPTSAAVWLTSADGVHRLARQPDLPLVPAGSNRQITSISVDPADVGQEIDGFGASLNESGAW